jgi:hypothetical protein
MTQIRVSMNELSALLKRTFEGLGYVTGDCVDAAAACIWMETHGLNGLALVSETWSRLCNSSELVTQVREADAGNMLIDANDASLLVCGHKVSEIVLAAALDSNTGRVELLNCHSRMAIAASIATIAKVGASSLAHWHNGESQFYAASLHGEILPRVARTDLAKTSHRATNTLYLVCSADPAVVESELRSLDPVKGQIESIGTPESMSQCFEEKLEYGLPLKPEIWDQLNMAADKVLVIATEQSRRGAGA